MRETKLRAQAFEAENKALQADNKRKELELQKTADLKAAYAGLEKAHENLKATQQQLITQEKLASLGQLTAGIAHESANLVFHGIRTKQPGFNVKFEKDYDQLLETLDIVPQDIGRVFINIIGNACYAVDKRAQEQISGFSPKIWLKTRGFERRVEFRIRDNGPGIPVEIRDEIFNPFFTTNPVGQGTGLGLSICHDIVVQAHHGTIEIESQECEFTEFVISLPR